MAEIVKFVSLQIAKLSITKVGVRSRRKSNRRTEYSNMEVIKMNKTRLPIIIIAITLFSTAILALQAYQRTMEVMESNLPYTGMGDLHLFEAQQTNAAGGALENSPSYAGMGDLRRFEALQSIPVTAGQTSSRPYVGMGDLRRFEAQQEFLKRSREERPAGSLRTCVPGVSKCAPCCLHPIRSITERPSLFPASCTRWPIGPPCGWLSWFFQETNGLTTFRKNDGVR